MGILSGVPCAIKKVLISYLFYIKQCVYGASLVAQLVKNLPAMQETLVIELKDILLSPFRIHLICSAVFSASECIS